MNTDAKAKYETEPRAMQVGENHNDMQGAEACRHKGGMRMKSYEKLENEMIDRIDEIMDRFDINRADIISIVKDRVD